MQPKPRRKRLLKPQPGYDAALKEMLSAAHDTFLALILPGTKWRATLSEEVRRGSRRADLVWEVETSSGERGIAHFELQIKIETARKEQKIRQRREPKERSRKRTEEPKDIRERMAEYALLLYLRDHLPVYSVVIFLKPGNTPEPHFGWRWNGRELLSFNFEIIRLWEQPPELVLNTQEYNLWPLAGLMGKQVTEDTTFAVAEKIVQAPIERQEKSRLVGILGLLAGMRLPKANLMQALERDHMIEEIWKESSFGEAAAEILRPEVEAKLRPEVEAKLRPEVEAKIGAARKAEGMREMAQVALEGRLGTLSAEVLAALERADEATLKAIVAHISTDTPEQIQVRLGLR